MALDPLTASIDAVSNIGSALIKHFFPDPTKQAEAEQKLAELKMSGDLQVIAGQLEINKVEAASTNWFIAGARPFILWGCGFALIYAALLEPFLRFFATVVFHYTGTFPVLDASFTTQILMGLLGLGGMRTFEKYTNTEKNR